MSILFFISSILAVTQAWTEYASNRSSATPAPAAAPAREAAPTAVTRLACEPATGADGAHACRLRISMN